MIVRSCHEAASGAHSSRYDRRRAASRNILANALEAFLTRQGYSQLPNRFAPAHGHLGHLGRIFIRRRPGSRIGKGILKRLD
jgi:hypothetical protein